MKKNDYFSQNSWSLAPLDSVQEEMRWRVQFDSPPVDCIIAGYSACCHYVFEESSCDVMVITLPENLNPSLYSWPVSGLGVALVETGCYERELTELCKQYGADFLALHERALDPMVFNIADTSQRFAA